ncbi:nicotinate-nucleotide adenylyltransferase [Desemzia sp. FAM 23991]|uniref:nicotinate-nucleotide adenylyltransferase n=1 Tax=unclassified Desemzia TaxID=2685243 RepID=UPI003884EE81
MKESFFSGKRTQVLSEPVAETTTKKRVGILGGTFNPPHVAHLMIADQVCQQLGLDKVYFMPTAAPPHVDTKKTIAAEHRLKMVERAIQDNPKFDLETIEIERGGKSYTYETMLQLTQQNPDTEYYFIIGADMVNYLPKWHKIDELAQLIQFVGVKRPGYVIESQYPLIWVDVPEIAVSSTSLRKKIATGCTVNYLIPQKVLEYIYQEGLYSYET